MLPTESCRRRAFRLRKRQVFLVGLGVVFAAGAIGLTSFFRLGSETQALRRSFMRSVGGEWDKQFALRVGSLSLGLARLATRPLALPPEARAALEAVRGAEVGVYASRNAPGVADRRQWLAAADRAVKGLGWDRVVGVVHEREVVAVYVPRRGLSATRVACCVAVVGEGKLVIVSARGNPERLLEMAARKLEQERPAWTGLASR